MKKFMLFALMISLAILGYSTGVLSGIGLYAGIGISATMLPKMSGSFGITTVFTEGLCPIIQEALINIYKQKAPELARTKVGYLESIIGARNTAGMTMLPFPNETGKTRTVRLTYNKRGCEDQIVDEAPVCDAEPLIENEPFEKDYDINNFKGTEPFKFTESEMRKLCGTDQEWITRTMNGLMDPLITSLDKSLIALQAANFGQFNPNLPAGYMPVDLIYGDMNAAMPSGEMDILGAFEDINVSDRPILIGKGLLHTYAGMQKIGCCNDAGQDISAVGNFDYYYDRFVGNILGDKDRFIGLAPGRVQLLTWNKYVGEYRKNNDVFVHDTIVDPVTGLQFDFNMWYNYKCDYFAIKLGLYYELVFLPDDAFAYCDELAGVNYTLQFQANKAT